MSNMRDYDMDVVLAKVEHHLQSYDDGRLAKVAAKLAEFPEFSEERALIANLVGSIRIVRDSTRIALAQEALRKRDDLHEMEDDVMFAQIEHEVMFHMLTNSYLDARSREIMYRILHKTLHGTAPENTMYEELEATAPAEGEPFIEFPDESEEDKRHDLERVLAREYLQALADDGAEDKWLRMIAEENEDDGLEQGEQPLVLDDAGVIRFRENRIIRLLLDAGPFDLNQIALMAFSDQERQLLAQLIGYSVSGYGDLPYAEGEPTARADRAVDVFIAEQEAE